MAKPYSFEPRRVGSRSSVNKSSYHSDAKENRRYSDGTDRTVNRNWCICEHCSVMATVEECVCCREFDAINSKLHELPSISCVTQHDRFAAVCLDVDVLRSVVVLLHDVQASQLEDPISNRQDINCYCSGLGTVACLFDDPLHDDRMI